MDENEGKKIQNEGISLLLVDSNGHCQDLKTLPRQQLCHYELLGACHANKSTIIMNHAPGNNSSTIRDNQYSNIYIGESIGQVNNYIMIIMENCTGSNLNFHGTQYIVLLQ